MESFDVYWCVDMLGDPMGSKPDDAAFSLGLSIERRRRQLGLRWQELAARAHISRTTLRSLVRGETTPRWATIQSIAQALETSAWDLVRQEAPAGNGSDGRDPFVEQVCEAIGRLPPNRQMAVAQIVDVIAGAPADAPASDTPPADAPGAGEG